MFWQKIKIIPIMMSAFCLGCVFGRQSVSNFITLEKDMPFTLMKGTFKPVAGQPDNTVPTEPICCPYRLDYIIE